MTALDIVVLLLVGGGAAFGVMRGFVTEILSLVAWIVAVLALKLFYLPASHRLAGPVGSAAGASVLAFALIFGIVFLGGRLVARSLGRRSRTSVLGPIDRALGLCFGAVKGLIGATLLFLLANLVYDTGYGGASLRPGWMRDSRSYPLLQASGRAIVDFVAARRAIDPADNHRVARDAS